MVRLATVGSSFHARVIAARLGSEGIVTNLRGNVDGLYPVGDIHVYVDEVESAFDPMDEEFRPPRELWLVVAAILGMAAILFSRAF